MFFSTKKITWQNYIFQHSINNKNENEIHELDCLLNIDLRENRLGEVTYLVEEKSIPKVRIGHPSKENKMLVINNNVNQHFQCLSRRNLQSLA